VPPARQELKREAGTMQHVQGSSRIWIVRNMLDRTGYK
jgi:hypothetical protein